MSILIHDGKIWILKKGAIMSVIVKGMKMPDCCKNCYLEHFGICTPTRSVVSAIDWGKKSDNCPIAELPKKHGRLIDADEIGFNMTNAVYRRIAEEAIAEAPTVFEAE